MSVSETHIRRHDDSIRLPKGPGSALRSSPDGTVPARCRHRYIYHKPDVRCPVPKEGQRSVTIRTETYAEVQRLVKRNPELYGSVSEFVKQGINDLILKTRAGRK